VNSYNVADELLNPLALKRVQKWLSRIFLSSYWKEEIMTNRNRLGELISALEQQRDELALKINLGKKEARDEWGQVTDRLDKLQDEYKPVKDAMKESASNVTAALFNVGKEIQESFQRIRKSL
jgi:uncharacterized coiled-coil DUF342 family protein